METPGIWNRVDQGQMNPGRVTKNSSTQTDCRIEGEKVNTVNGTVASLLKRFVDDTPERTYISISTAENHRRSESMRSFLTLRHK